MVGLRSCFFFFSSRRRHTRFDCDWSSDVCSSDLVTSGAAGGEDLDLLALDFGADSQDLQRLGHGAGVGVHADDLLLALLQLLLVGDRKSTRLNSSHSQISYAVFCFKKKKKHPLDR